MNAHQGGGARRTVIAAAVVATIALAASASASGAAGAAPTRAQDRPASQPAAAGSWTVPLENISRDGVDAAVVYVQDGSRENPGPMLGAAYTSLH